MAGHTPGPWDIVRYGDGDSLVIHSDSESRICFMATPGSMGDPEKIAADARLIAAAPELLAALQKIVRDWDGEPEDMVEANAVIRKATRGTEGQGMPDPTDNAKLAERLRETTSQMARRASVDMDLWNEHSNAVLEAATALASSAALNESLVGQARTELEWLRGQIFALCEDTEAAYDAVKTLDDEMGAYARGRIKEAKGIRTAIGEVVGERLRALLADMGKGDGG